MADSLSLIPEGFLVTKEGEGIIHIEYKTTGMGCMLVFLGGWLAGWSCFLIWLIYSLVFENDISVLPVAIGFGLGEVVVGIILLWFLFGRMHYVLTPESLHVRKQLFYWSKTREYPVAKIKAFVQVKDGGEGDDSFPSWGLTVDVGKRFVILSRQQPNKSRWLGEVLSQWSGKDFQKSADQCGGVN